MKVLISFLFSLFSAISAQTESIYQYKVQINKQGAMAEWRRLNEDAIEFQITAPKFGGQFGWFGFGFSPSGGMRGSDIVVGFIDENGNWTIEVRIQ